MTSIVDKAWKRFERQGLQDATKKTIKLLSEQRAIQRKIARNPDEAVFFDVLFINGCDYSVPHPVRYRVDHQIQQLEANGLTVKRVDAWNLTLDHLREARSFIIFRCPFTPMVGDFIEGAHTLNKRTYFDIDDLVIDTKYTNQISYLDTLDADAREQYDNGVVLMGKTLKLCGRAITTTDRLALELASLVPDVFINRNVASEDMIYYSQRAVYERDVLPHKKANEIDPSESRYWRWACENAKNRRTHGKTVIGYFSGSITHNEDFQMIIPALVSVMEKREDVILYIAGELDVPDALSRFADRILAKPFCDWEELPELIASTDINIAPLVDSIFNEAKSENKWIEAALVKVPTIASNIGAFRKVISDGETGILCDSVEDWEQAIMRLVDDRELRKEIGASAYSECMDSHITLKTGNGIADYIRTNQTENFFFILPSLDISGGVLVALRHAGYLQDAGYDVSIIDNSNDYPEKWVEYHGHRMPVIHAKSRQNKDDKVLVKGQIDTGVATFWDTTLWLKECSTVGRRLYLVQNFEPEMYPPPISLRLNANATYCDRSLEYITISKWCKQWLKERYGQDSKYAGNGIDLDIFEPAERDFSGRIRILIEGDSESYYKNVDEAFRIVSLLDKEKYEIWYMSYNAYPKAEYRVDRFFHKVPHERVSEVYRQCHILLKTSILESFSYPPLEMMATGGYVVAAPNGGNIEYLVDGENCLFYSLGEIDRAADQIGRIVQDAHLRSTLLKGAKQTVSNRSWDKLKDDVLLLYGAD